MGNILYGMLPMFFDFRNIADIFFCDLTVDFRDNVGIVPYDLTEDFLPVLSAKCNEIRAVCAVIIFCNAISFSLMKFRTNASCVTVLVGEGGAPRSESPISMLAGGKYTEIHSRSFSIIAYQKRKEKKEIWSLSG